jgi:hypothetical protein
MGWRGEVQQECQPEQVNLQNGLLANLGVVCGGDGLEGQGSAGTPYQPEQGDLQNGLLTNLGVVCGTQGSLAEQALLQSRITNPEPNSCIMFPLFCVYVKR